MNKCIGREVLNWLRTQGIVLEYSAGPQMKYEYSAGGPLDSPRLDGTIVTCRHLMHY